MATSTSKSYYWKGFRDAAPFTVVVVPFATLLGVMSTDTGFSIIQTVAFAAAVFAGAALFAALQLMQEGAPLVVVLASALAVNSRLVMYSASLTPYLGAAPLWQRAIAAFCTIDQNFALSSIQYEKEPGMTVAQRMAYFFGAVSPVTPPWLICAYLGASFGTKIPENWALDFALPIAFLAMFGPMMRSFPHVVGALVAVVVALLAINVPYNLGLIMAGLAGIIAGAQTELFLERRKATA
ncbi:MAG: AzlC family ABC transporter permease [Ruegeria sp.]